MNKVWQFILGFLGTALALGIAVGLTLFVDSRDWGLSITLVSIFAIWGVILLGITIFSFSLARNDKRMVGYGILTVPLVIVIAYFAMTAFDTLSIRAHNRNILNYETFADLSDVGLGIYKIEGNSRVLSRTGYDIILWDITEHHDFGYPVRGVTYIPHFNSALENAFIEEHLLMDVEKEFDIFFHNGVHLFGREGGNMYMSRELRSGSPVFDLWWYPDEEIIDRLRYVAHHETKTGQELVDILFPSGD
jgi:hypothetical protein